MRSLPKTHRRTRRTLAAVVGALLCLPLAACGSEQPDGGHAANPPAQQTRPKAKPATLTVLAASSLTDAFQHAAKQYEDRNPGTHIRFSFAGSQSLAAQVRQGAPADVLVTANEPTMKSVASDVDKPVTIATNRLTIVTEPGDPHHVESLQDLTDPHLKVVLAAPQVPAGSYSKKILAKQHLSVHPVSLESDVRSVLTKVELGEADAGIVYVSDAHAAGKKVSTVPIPAQQNAVAHYPAAVVKDSRHPKAAAAFAHYLTTTAGFAFLSDEGFLKP
jgi:molybdate transport system substrate-binding protein